MRMKSSKTESLMTQIVGHVGLFYVCYRNRGCTDTGHH
jgi:hypothetical protein